MQTLIVTVTLVTLVLLVFMYIEIYFLRVRLGKLKENQEALSDNQVELYKAFSAGITVPGNGNHPAEAGPVVPASNQTEAPGAAGGQLKPWKDLTAAERMDLVRKGTKKADYENTRVNN